MEGMLGRVVQSMLVEESTLLEESMLLEGLTTRNQRQEVNAERSTLGDQVRVLGCCQGRGGERKRTETPVSRRPV